MDLKTFGGFDRFGAALMEFGSIGKDGIMFSSCKTIPIVVQLV